MRHYINFHFRISSFFKSLSAGRVGLLRVTPVSDAALKPVMGACARVAARQAQAGFTLIELVMVILILGVLSAYAAPRMFNSGDFYARGFHDETLSILRYAQKAAIAQRRTVCVDFVQGPPAKVTLAIASVNGALTCNTALAWPNKSCAGPFGSTACIEAKSGIGYVSVPIIPLTFNGLGKPSAGQVITVSGGTSTFTETVEAETGHVHD